MKKTLFKFLRYIFLLSLIAYLFAVLIPRKYDVPAQQTRTGTQYWFLPTGSKIAYSHIPAKGKKKPYPIVFLQGGPGGFISDRNILSLAPLSEDGFDIYLYDPTGSGLSDRLSNIQEYTAMRHKIDLEGILEKIGSEKVILIGQSWGAILATLFVADHASKVYKIIFTGPGPIQPTRPELLNIPAPDSLNLKMPAYSNKEANSRANNLRMHAIKFLAKNFGIKWAPDKEVDEFQTYLNHELNKAVVCNPTNANKAEAGGGFYAQIMTLQSFKEIKDPRPKLKDLSIPILIMKGECDNQAWGFATEYLELFPNHQLKIIPAAGHSISVEQPELYLEIIRGFLNPLN